MHKTIAELPHLPGESPFVVARGGFYRRWLQMIDDIEELENIVKTLLDTTENNWVPVWRKTGLNYEKLGDEAAKSGDWEASRRLYLQAKTYYSIARFPAEITPLKKAASDDCVRAYRKACKHIDPPLETMEVNCEGLTIRAHFRTPKTDAPVPAVLVMCGADMFKEDRGWVADVALESGLAALVMDAPGTGENPFPWEPDSVKAWVAAVEALMHRPEVDSAKIGAFGISRGGYSVLQLAGTAPERIRAVVAVAGHPFHNDPSDEEMAAIVNTRNERAKIRFGAENGPGWAPDWSVEKEREMARNWSLQSLGLIEKINMPVLLINGDSDGLAPVSNIYFMLEHGVPGLTSARVYRDSGHCAFEHQREWGPASFAWLAERLRLI